MNKKINNSITSIWNKSKQLIAEGKLEEADDALMTIIWKVADYTMEGHNDDYRIEGVKKGVWYERAWTAIEVNGLLPE